MADGRTVVVTGATGLIGRRLCRRLSEMGYRVVVFARNSEAARRAAPDAAEWVAWTAAETGPWAGAVDGAHAVVNLAGAPIIGKRWSDAYKREIRDSRVVATRGLVNAMRAAYRTPKVFVGGSAVGYYGARDDTPLDESAAPGRDFLARLCVDWEAEALKARDIGVRAAVIRTGIVLSDQGGALKTQLLPFRFFVGGPILPGTQWTSWIHLEDEVGIILLALENEQAEGPFNATAPNPQTNRDFSGAIGNVLGRPDLFPVPGFALKLALGEAAGTLVTGQRAIPKRASDLGYTFQFPTSELALRDLLKKQ